MKKKELVELLANSNIFELASSKKIRSIQAGVTETSISITEKIEDVEPKEKKLNGKYLAFVYCICGCEITHLTLDKEEKKKFAKEELIKMTEEE